MLKATFKTLMAHKGRLLLTALAVIIGVGFMAGTFVLTDTVKTSIDGLISSGTAGKAVVVRGVSVNGNSSNGIGGGGGLGGNALPLVPETLIPTIKAVPGVTAVDGAVLGTVILSRNGTSLGPAGGAPTVGLAWEPDRVLSLLKLSSGHAPEGPGQVVIDKKTATSRHVRIGDVVTVTGNLGPQPFTVVGIVTFGSQDTIAGATLTSFDTATAQQIFGKPGYFTDIDVASTPNANDNQLAMAIGAVLPARVEAVSAATAAAQSAASFDSLINNINTALLVFGFIALFVGAFVIFNTFSILIGQRTRELALLRAVGAGRGQVTGSVLGEAIGLGVIGGAGGLGFGILLAFLLTHLLKGAFSLSSTSLQILPRTIIASLGVGAAVTFISAILPAYRAARIPPVAAMREDLPSSESSLRRRAIIGAVVLAGGILFMVLGLTGQKSLTKVGIASLLIFVGVAILVPLVARLLANVIGAPAVVLGIVGGLGRENAARNPRRTAATASALMIGIAVVAAVATFASSALASFAGVFDQEFTASYVVSSTGQPFPAAPAEAALRKAPGVTALSGLENLSVDVGHASETVDGIDGTQGPQVLKIVTNAGSVGSLAQGKLLVDQTTATDDHLAVGQSLTMVFNITGSQTYTIGGIYADNSLLSDHYVLATTVLEGNTNNLRDRFVLVKTSTTDAAEQAAISKAMSGFPNLKIQTGAQYKAAQEDTIKKALNVLYVLLVLSIVIALFGVVNTLALSVLERTREIGLLRAVGMLRRQSRGMILVESVIVCVLGAVLGLVIGLSIGAAIVEAVASSGAAGTVLAFPVATIIAVVILAAFFGLIFGLIPAQRAARLDVLRAISTA